MKIFSTSSRKSVRRRLVCLAILTAFLAVPARADDGDKPLPNFTAPSMDANAAKNGEPNLITLQTRASKGDPGAQQALGKRYDDGDGVAKDPAAAVKWYSRAAQQGNTKAQNALGNLYMTGAEGVPQDYGQAYFWITLSLDPFDPNSASIREDIKKYLGPEQLTDQEKHLNEWKPVLEQQAAAGGDDAAAVDAGCTARDVAASMELPKHATADCKNAQRNMHYECSTPSCTDCETALNNFNVQCTRSDTDTIDPAFNCDSNADCFLLDKNCSLAYDPIAVNREHLQEVRKKRNYPMEDCGRSLAMKQQYHALCLDAVCSVRTSSP